MLENSSIPIFRYHSDILLPLLQQMYSLEVTLDKSVCQMPLNVNVNVVDARTFTHTHTHAHTDARTHARTHTHTHTHTQAVRPPTITHPTLLEVRVCHKDEV